MFSITRASEETRICLSLIAILLNIIHLYDVETAFLRVPMKNALDARPVTPLYATPTWPRRAQSSLDNAYNVQVRAINPGIPSPGVPPALSLAMACRVTIVLLSLIKRTRRSRTRQPLAVCALALACVSQYYGPLVVVLLEAFVHPGLEPAA